MPFTQDDLVARATDTEDDEVVTVAARELEDLKASVPGAVEKFGREGVDEANYEVAGVRFRVDPERVSLDELKAEAEALVAAGELPDVETEEDFLSSLGELPDPEGDVKADLEAAADAEAASDEDE